MVTATMAVSIPLGLERLIGPHLVINHTASLPPGLYWRSAIPAGGPHHGDVVISCIPAPYAQFAHSAGILDVGECDGIESMMKVVVAVPGDHVLLNQNGVSINGRFLSGSKPIGGTTSGHTMPHVAYGNYHLKGGQYWLASPKAMSFDSRYYGPVSQVLSIASAILVFPK